MPRSSRTFCSVSCTDQSIRIEFFDRLRTANITQQCTYNYPNFTSVRDWIDFSMKVCFEAIF